MSKNSEGGAKVICVNKKAHHNYHIEDKIEAGLVLEGWEIKSIRSNQVTIAESYVRPEKGEIFLIGAHMNPPQYTQASNKKVANPTRARKLLLKRIEIDRLASKVQEKGLTLVPLKIYLKNGRAKLEVGLAKGKSAPDKRHSIKERDSKREMARAIKQHSN